MDYSILGPLRVRLSAAAEPIELGDKAELVLGRLLLEPRTTISDRRLGLDVWGEPVRSNTIQQTVRRLRDRLGDDDDERTIIHRVGTTGYCLAATDLAIDAERFELLARRGRALAARRPHAARAMLAEALASWRGPLLGEHAELPWVAPAAEALAVVRNNAEVALNDVRLALGEHAELEGDLRRQLVEHELDERRHRQLIRALQADGRDAEATDAYLLAYQVLGEQRSPELRQLGDRIGRGRRPAPPAAAAVQRDASRPGWVLVYAVLEPGHRDDRPGLGTLAAVFDREGGSPRPVGTNRVVGMFPDPAAAERAARTVAGDARLRCAVGLHVGAAVQLGDHLFGPGPARCRLLAEAAHPGQVLVSAAARARHWSTAGLRDLGEQRYEDLLPPEVAFQLPADGDGGDDFPLPDTLSRHRHNLPIQQSRFVGRADDLDTLSRLVADGELITLVGPGGCGKSRLALQLAARSTSAFPDGAWFAGLAELPRNASAETVAMTIVNQLGARPVANETAIQTFDRHLADRSVVLVIDNCEHVLAACTELIASLRTRSPRTCVLATSIQPLEIGWERQVEVPSMATEPGATEDELPDAVELLLERAGSLPDAEHSEAALREAGEVCRLLEGLPLAIELAAGQIARRGLAGLAVELAAMLEGHSTLESLGDGGAGRAPRHATIEATIRWSHRLLDTRQRTILHRLAAFRGSFGLAEAELIAADDEIRGPELVDVIWSLVNCSMVASQPPLHGAPRLRLRLPIRRFAADRLRDGDDERRTRQRHVEVYRARALRTAPTLFGPGEDAGLAALAADHDNLRAALAGLIEERRVHEALTLVGALWWLWFSHGHFEEGVGWVDSVLALDPTPSRERVRALRAGSHLAWWRGAYADTINYNKRLRECATAIGDDWGLAWAPMGEAAVLMFPDPAQALPLLAESRERFAASGFAWEAGYALMLIGGANWFAGEIADAGVAYAQAAELFEALEHGSVLASARRGAGLMTALDGNRERGMVLCHQALTFSESIGDRGGSAQALNFLAAIARDADELDVAVERHAAALAYAREVGELWATCSALDGIAAVACADGELTLAARLLACSAALAKRAGWHPAKHERALRAADEATLKARLDPRDHNRASAEGELMSVASATTAALAFARRYADG